MGDSFASPAIQEERMRTEAERQDLDLITILDEIDVSGGLALDKRRGMGPAIEAIEAGRAEVLIVAYFDRLVRNIGIQQEIIDRVEAAGGAVLTVDFGQVSHATATQWLTASQMGLVNDYVRRVARERSGEAQARAVARGVVPFPNVPPGLRISDEGTAEADPETIDAVREAFDRRYAGEPIREVRAFLQSRGIARSFHGVQAMLANRLYVGEIHFGSLVNLDAHESVIDRGLFEAVQRTRVTRGRRPKSDRLLARLGVLRCGTCGARMVVGSLGGPRKRYAMYRCPPVSDCQRRVTIAAEMIEEFVIAEARRRLADEKGTASAESRAREVVAVRDRAQADLDAAFRAFGGFTDEPAARERIGELVAIRDAAQQEVDQLGPSLSSLTISAAADWDRLSRDAQRALIAAVIPAVRVAPGRGLDRVTIEPLVK